jgi:methyl-accepting chemotaxis protein
MIFVASDLTELNERLAHYPVIVGGMFAAALLVAFILSTRVQRLVSGPILHLAQVARTVALDKNYSVRAKKHSTDELGQLIDGFNEMLTQIQERDGALRAAHDNLERRVEERDRRVAPITRDVPLTG